jgi:putative salt-induced outer membrane protein YdiY
MKLKILGCAMITGVAMSQTVNAEDELSREWSGSASLGAVMTDGNSDTRNIAGSINVARQADLWRHNAFGSIYNAEANGEETANRLELGYKLDRSIDERSYVFGRLRYDTDEFGNIDNRYSGIVGVGRTFISTARVSFGAEIGIGVHQTEYLEPLDGELEADGGTIYIGANYSNAITDTVTFNSVLSAELTDSNNLTVWDNILNVRLSERLSLGLGLLTRNNSDITGDLGENTDTTTQISLNYGI